MDPYELMEEAMAGSGGDKFLSPKEGEGPFVLTIFGRPHVEKLWWNGANYELWDDDNVDHDSPTFEMNVNAYDHNLKKMRILQGKVSLIIAYNEALEEYGKDTGETKPSGKPVKTIEHRVFKVSKHGKGTQTRFPFLLQPDIPVPAEVGTPWDLEAQSAQKWKKERPAPAPAPNSDLPF